MKNFMMMVLVLGGTVLVDSSVANADHRLYGGRGNGFSVSFGNGRSQFSYSQGVPRSYYGHGYGHGHDHGGYYSSPVIAVPVYRSYPTYSVPVYGGYSGYDDYGYGYGGYQRHCH